MELKNTGFAPEAIYLRGVSEYQGEIGDALYICSFFRKGFVIVTLYAKRITNWSEGESRLQLSINQSAEKPLGSGLALTLFPRKDQGKIGRPLDPTTTSPWRVSR